MGHAISASGREHKQRAAAPPDAEPKRPETLRPELEVTWPCVFRIWWLLVWRGYCGVLLAAPVILAIGFLGQLAGMGSEVLSFIPLIVVGLL
jgi:hypothetical protein